MTELNDSAHFFQEQHGIELGRANRVAFFMEFADQEFAVTEANVWVAPKEDLSSDLALYRNCRVYLTLYSQNRFAALKNCINSPYYNPDENDLFLSYYDGDYALSQIISRFSNYEYSGAKTREIIKEFLESFEVEKLNW